MDVGIFGTGYVGLVTGLCFAKLGFRVGFFDVSRERRVALSNGRLPILEPGLDEVFLEARSKNLIQVFESAESMLESVPVSFACVPTPSANDGSANLEFLLELTQTVAIYFRLNNKQHLFVIKSTVPVGTSARVERTLPSHVQVAFNPEFLREGSALSDFLNADRVVLGATDLDSLKPLKRLYESLTNRGTKLFLMDLASAEMTKLCANAFLAMRVSFANEMARTCELMNASATAVLGAVGADARIGSRFLQPGPGFGGSCFPKDLRSLSFESSKSGRSFQLVDAALRANDEHQSWMSERSLEMLNEIKEPVVAVLGLSFKANTDDTRDSPAITLARRLLKANVRIQAYDPEAHLPPELTRELSSLGGSFERCSSVQASLQGADLMIIATEWQEFAKPLGDAAKGLMRRPYFFDLRRIVDRDSMRKHGVQGHVLGEVN